MISSSVWILLACLSQLLNSLEDAVQPTFLITSGGSFVSYHAALRLAERGNVIVLDEFKRKLNNLQKLRAQKLATIGILVRQGNLCNPHLVTELFRQYQFQAVIYSTPTIREEDDIMRHLELNTECIANFFEVLKKYESTYLIFLSSGSVYNGSPLPHSSVSPFNNPPPNIPVALKISAEEMVSTYCKLYSLNIIRLRLFSVYGPWSGPGDLVYDMAKQLYGEGEVNIPIKSFVAVKRDFVFIDDVVEGILLLLGHTPNGCNEVYNIGSGQAVSVESVLELLEASFNKKKQSSVSAGEPEVTQADISESRKVWNYNPSVPMQEGISKFTIWFKQYYKQKSSNFEPDASLENSVLLNHVKYKSEQYVERVRDLREKYEKYAEERGYPVSKLYRTKTFTKHSGFNFNGGNNQKTHDLKELQYRCQLFDECMGYDTDGKIKGVLDPESSWRKGSGAVYVADVDICKAGVHKCYGNASCVYTGATQFKCACPSGWKLYRDHDCIELYKKGHKSQAEAIEEITDKIDGLDWNTFASSEEFYPFKGKTVKNEFLVYYPEAKDNIPLLKEACRTLYHCMGFTSDGVLMSNVDVRKWENDHTVTLYARDVDYCSVDEVKCRPGQGCGRESPGKYACM